MKVGIVGAGYVGLTLGVACSLRGLEVKLVERSKIIIKKVSSGKSHFYEEGFDPLLKSCIDRNLLAITDNYSELVDCNYKIITIGTPIDKSNSFSLENILNVIKSLSEFIKDGDIIILRSTVGVGSTRRVFETLSTSKNINMAYCPERVAAGKMLSEIFSLPQLIGPINEESQKKAVKLFSQLTDKIIVNSSPEVSELAKLTNNTFRDFQFGFSNLVAMASNEFEIDPIEVIDACNKNYGRASIAYPGLVGGSCLEKDPYILAASFKNTSTDSPLANLSSWSRITNSRYFYSLLEKFKKALVTEKEIIKKVGILGAAFKGHPVTDDLRGSFLFPLIKNLKDVLGSPEISVYDKKASLYHKEYKFWVNNLEKIIKDNQVIVFQNNSHEFSTEETLNLFDKITTKKYIIDFWNVLSNKRKYLNNNIEVISYGYSRSK